MSTSVRVEIADGLAAVRLDREHGNAINGTLSADLHRAFAALEGDPAVRGVLLGSAHPKLFCPGLDLRELIELDRPAMSAFMGGFADCLLTLYTFPKPVVAALSGAAVAGGCVIAMTADHRVLREGAVIGMGEVRLGVGLPYGVTVMLSEALRRNRLEEVALLGRNYAGRDAVDAGLAHETHPAEGFEDYCRERLGEFASKEPLAFAQIKRYLRSSSVALYREKDAALRDEWLDVWFTAATRARLRAMVEQLTAGKV